MRQLIPRLATTWGRSLLTLLACLYFIVAIALLVLRYGVLPHLDAWRPQIAAQLSAALDADVELGPIRVRWRGWNPEFDVQGVHLRSRADGSDLLVVPAVRASLNWAALLPGPQGPLRLQVQGMNLGLERLPDGRLSLLGQTLVSAAQASAAQSTESALWFQWLLAQPLIAFHEATLRWRDTRRGAPELRLDGVEAVLARSAQGGLDLALSAQATAAGDARLDLRIHMADAAVLRQGRLPSLWRAWLRIAHAQAHAWRPWVDLPAPLQQGQFDAQLWAGSAGTEPELTVLAGIQGLRWSSQTHGLVQVPQAQAWVQGALSQWRGLWQGGPMPGGLAFQVRTQDIGLTQPDWFDHALDFGAVSARGQLLNPGAWTLVLDQLQWRNADIDLRAEGRWQAGGTAGHAALRGSIVRGRLDAIHRYLPLEVDADARDWLARGLQAGELFNGQWLLQGDLAEFPFGEQPQAGDFRVWGDFRQARLDFVPDAAPADRWPLMHIVTGTADLHRMDLHLTAASASMDPAPGQRIGLFGVQARIPDLEHEATLQVSGQSAAPGSAYMALIQHSPLNDMLDGVFAQARAAGDWQMPLSLTVPLMHSLDTRVQGRIDLQGARLQLLPDAPAFEAIHGQLHFSERGVRIARPIQARLLGGAVDVSGSLGGDHDQGLTFQGRMAAESLAGLAGVPGMKRITGSLDYQAHLVRQGRAHVLSLTSDTRGLTLDFPAPLAKPDDQARTLSLQWTDADPKEDALDVRYGDVLRLVLRHRRDNTAGAYFQGVAIGLGQAAAAVEPGLQIGIAYPLFDLDRWNRIVDEFSVSRRGQEAASRAKARPLWPDLTLLSVRADQLRLLGTRLDQAVLRVVRSREEQWSMNLRSLQTTGTLKWQERDGQVLGRMSGRFSRLSLGDDPHDTNSLLPPPDADEEAAFDDDLDIPGIVLQADELRLYGHSVGGLSLEGERDRINHVWRLSDLRLGDADARLRGTGVWRLRGADRGLSLKASVAVKDMGAWLARVGQPNALAGGQGTIKGQFEWRNLPWSYAWADLKGDLTVELDKGRFLKLGSHSAKLLEMLSLQSITRLTKLEQGLTSLPKDGFPFDAWRGSMSLDQGEVQVHDYKIIGSAGTILLEGSTNIIDQTLNLQAVIVPNLDVSGAALAAGIAINPVIGVGAFLSQWLLKSPLARAMTVRYRITGSWDDPVVKEAPLEPSAKAAPAGR